MTQDLNRQLFAAAREGQVDQVRRLLTEGADLATPDAYGQTVLYLAIERDDLSVVQALIAHQEAQHGTGAPLPLGNRPNYLETLLDRRPCRFETFAYLLEHGLEPDPELAAVAYQILVDEGLLQAARENGRPVAPWLVWGADANARNAAGQTALSIVVRAGGDGASQAVTELLAHGADPNRPDADGTLPLHHAALCWTDTYARLLLKAGADPALRCPRGQWEGLTALEVARATHHPAAETLLAPVSPRSWRREYSQYLHEHAPTSEPRYAAPDYRSQYSAPYVCVVEKAGYREYRGVGVPPSEHPLVTWPQHPRMASRIITTPCLACGKEDVLVIYASWSRRGNLGDISWKSEVYCPACGQYTRREYDES